MTDEPQYDDSAINKLVGQLATELDLDVGATITDVAQALMAYAQPAPPAVTSGDELGGNDDASAMSAQSFVFDLPNEQRACFTLNVREVQMLERAKQKGKRVDVEKYAFMQCYSRVKSGPTDTRSLARRGVRILSNGGAR